MKKINRFFEWLTTCWQIKRQDLTFGLMRYSRFVLNEKRHKQCSVFPIAQPLRSRCRAWLSRLRMEGLKAGARCPTDLRTNSHPESVSPGAIFLEILLNSRDQVCTCTCNPAVRGTVSNFCQWLSRLSMTPWQWSRYYAVLNIIQCTMK